MAPTADYERQGAHGAASSTHHLGHGDGDGGARPRRQRVRRGRGGAGSCCRWSSRTCAGRAARCRPCSSRPATRRRGCCAARAWRRPRATVGAAARRARLLDRPRHRAAPGHRPRRVGRLADAAARPRHLVARRRARPGARLRGATGSRCVPRVPAAIGVVARALPRALAGVGGAPGCRTAGSRGGGIRLPALAATWRRLLAEAAAAGADREAQIDAARDAWYRGFVAEEIERFCRHPGPSTRRAATTPACSPATTWRRWSCDLRGRGRRPPAGGGWAVAKPAGRGRRVRCWRRAAAADGTDLAYVDGWRPRTRCTRPRRRRSWRSPTGRPGTATAAPVPLEELLSGEYADERRALIGATGVAGAAAGLPRRPRAAAGGARRRPAGPAATASSAPGLGEPTVSPHRRDPRRHGAHRRRGRGREHGLGDAVRGLAAVVADDPGARLLPGHPRADVLAGGGAAVVAGAGPAAAHHAVAVAGAARRRAACSRSARRAATSRTSGSCASGSRTRVGGLDLQAAIDAPTWHSTAFPSSFAPRGWDLGGLVVESRLGAATLDELRRRGHEVTVRARGRSGGCARWAGADRCCGPEPTAAAATAPPRPSEGQRRRNRARKPFARWRLRGSDAIRRPCSVMRRPWGLRRKLRTRSMMGTGPEYPIRPVLTPGRVVRTAVAGAVCGVTWKPWVCSDVPRR